MATKPIVEDEYMYYDAQGQPHKTAQEAIQASQQFEESVGGRNPSGGNCPQKPEDAQANNSQSQSGSTSSNQSDVQSDKR